VCKWVLAEPKTLVYDKIAFQQAILVEKPGEVLVGGFNDWKDVEIGPQHPEKRQGHEEVAQSGVCDKDEERTPISAGALKVMPFL
jgi:hypothetical protein